MPAAYWRVRTAAISANSWEFIRQNTGRHWRQLTNLVNINIIHWLPCTKLGIWGLAPHYQQNILGDKMRIIESIFGVNPIADSKETAADVHVAAGANCEDDHNVNESYYVAIAQIPKINL